MSSWEYQRRKENPYQTAARMYKDFSTDRLWERITNSLDLAKQTKEQEVFDHYTKVYDILQGYGKQLLRLETRSILS